MSVPTAGNGQIVQREAVTPEKQLLALLKRSEGEIARALPRHVTPDRMARVLLTALRTTPKLAECTQQSFLGCVMTCAQLGLEPNTPLGHAYLIPRWSGKLRATECTIIIGYQGLLDLVRRSGSVTGVWAFPVYKGDDYTVTYGSDPKIHHVPSPTASHNPADLVAAYACARLRDNDVPIIMPMMRGDIEKRRLRGASGRTNKKGEPISTPWDTDYEAMCLKTVLRALTKVLPKTIEATDGHRISPGERLALAAQVDDARPSATAAIAAALESADLPALPPIETTLASELDYDPTTGEVRAEDEPANVQAGTD